MRQDGGEGGTGAPREEQERREESPRVCPRRYLAPLVHCIAGRERTRKRTSQFLGSGGIAASEIAPALHSTAAATVAAP